VAVVVPNLCAVGDARVHRGRVFKGGWWWGWRHGPLAPSPRRVPPGERALRAGPGRAPRRNGLTRSARDEAPTRRRSGNGTRVDLSFEPSGNTCTRAHTHACTLSLQQSHRCAWAPPALVRIAAGTPPTGTESLLGRLSESRLRNSSESRRKPVRVAAGGACRAGGGVHLVEGGPEAHPLLRRGGPGESWEGNSAHNNGFSIRGIINCEELGRRIDNIYIYIYIYMGYLADFIGFIYGISGGFHWLCMLLVDNLNISTVYFISIPAVYHCKYTNSMFMYITHGILCKGTNGILRTTAAIRSKRPAPSNRFKTISSCVRAYPATGGGDDDDGEGDDDDVQGEGVRGEGGHCRAGRRRGGCGGRDEIEAPHYAAPLRHAIAPRSAST
jgi:hypothetical protein